MLPYCHQVHAPVERVRARIRNNRDRLKIDACGSRWRCSCTCGRSRKWRSSPLVALSSYFQPSSTFSVVKSSFVEPTLGVTTGWSLIAHLDGQRFKSKTGGLERWSPPGLYLDFLDRPSALPAETWSSDGCWMDFLSPSVLARIQSLRRCLGEPCSLTLTAETPRSLRRRSRRCAQRRRSMEARPVEIKKLDSTFTRTPGRRTSASQGRYCGCCVAEPVQPVTAILPGSQWSCLLLRVVLRDALSEVTKVYPPL